MKFVYLKRFFLIGIINLIIGTVIYYLDSREILHYLIRELYQVVQIIFVIIGPFGFFINDYLMSITMQCAGDTCRDVVPFEIIMHVGFIVNLITAGLFIDVIKFLRTPLTPEK